MSETKGWSVDTEVLGSVAKTLGEKIKEYETAYGKLYTELDSLRSKDFQGAASDALNQKLEDYRNTLVKVKEVLDTFKSNLSTAKSNYESAEETVKNAVAKL